MPSAACHDKPVVERYTGDTMDAIQARFARIARFSRWGLFFLLGAVATLGQVLFVRQFLTVAYGNELCLGLLFFFWFLGVSSGAEVGGWAASRVRERLWWLIFLMVVLVVVLGVQLAVIRSLRYILPALVGEYLSLGQLAWGAFLGVTPFSFLVGLIFPFAGQVARGEERFSPGGVSTVYILEAAGSLAAGALFTYVLLSHVTAFGMAKGAAVLVVALCLALAMAVWRLRLKRYRTPASPDPWQNDGKGQYRQIREAARVLLLFAVLPALAGLSAGDLEQRTAALRWRSQFPGVLRVHSSESPYGHLDLAETAGQYSLYSNGQLIGSFPDPYSYLEPVHSAMVQHVSPSQVLLVGGNPEMIRLILEHGVQRVDWVELDPALIDLMLKYSSAENRALVRDPRVQVYYEDGRRFIRRIADLRGQTSGSTAGESGSGVSPGGPYDLILLDVPDPSTAQLNRYYTEEFYREAKGALKADGVLVTSIQASVHATGEEVVGYGKVIASTLQRTFAEFALQPGQAYWFYASRVKGQVSEEPEVLAARFRQRGVQPEAFAYSFRTLFQPDRVKKLRAALESPPRPASNTDFHPVAYVYQLLVWNRWAGSDLSGLLLALRDRSPFWMLAVLGLLLAARFVVLRRREASSRHRLDLALAIAVLGLTGMSVELVLLFAFQNSFGVLYQKIAMVIALFMFGLTLGSFVMNRLVEGRKLFASLGRTDPRQSASTLTLSETQREAGLRILLVVSMLFVLVLPLCLRLAARGGLTSPAFFYALVGFSGILTGAGFPLVISLYHRPGQPVARAAGVIDCMDHLGAMVGALLTGTLWLPLWGVGTTCAILAVANAMALILLGRQKAAACP